jgi:hypothetical protein
MTLVTAFDQCTSSVVTHDRLGVSNIVLRFVLFIWFKNLTAHRYLYKRAKIVKIDM